MANELVGALDLSLSNLKHLDLGMVDELFKEALIYVGDDLRQRDRDEKSREVNIKFKFAPDVKSNDPADVLMEVEVTAKVPSFRSRMYRMSAQFDKNSRKTSLKFSTYSPDGSRTMFDSVRKPETGDDSQ